MKQMKITHSEVAYRIWTKAEGESWRLFDSYAVNNNAVDEQIVTDLMCLFISGYRFEKARIVSED